MITSAGTPDTASPAPLLRSAATCWRIERAQRAALLIDNADFFAAAKSSILKVSGSIWLLGWEFDPRRRLTPGRPSSTADRVGDLLNQLSAERPELQIYVLMWEAALGVALGSRLMPYRAANWFKGSRVHLRFDNSVPWGASHHQKLLIVDDAVAFCSGDDFAANRWDRPEHRDRDDNRSTPWGANYPPRHGATLMVDGPAANALGELARARWLRATNERAPPVDAPVSDAWPHDVKATFSDVQVGISRTMPAWGSEAEVREVEQLYLAGIAAARRLLYFENQYFASPVIGRALQSRLSEPHGPEIVVVTGEHAPNMFDRATMDPPRDALVRRLLAHDRYGRFRVYAPHGPEGRTVLVHSKVMIVDDRLLRVGSSNIADRSLGFDSECDIAIEGRDPAQRELISELPYRMIGHFLGCPADVVREAAEAAEGLNAAIQQLDGTGIRRLRPLNPRPLSFPRSLVARLHLGDPHGRADAWRPWRRDKAFPGVSN